MKLILVRHGQTNANKSKHGQTITEPLNETGLEQARKVAERLKDEKIDIAFVSDATRAMQTAEEILKFHPKTEKVVSKLLREIYRGYFEERSNGERLAWEQEQADNGIAFGEMKVDGAESRLDVRARMLELYNKVIADCEGKTVLWVSHGTAIYSFTSSLMGVSMKTRADVMHLLPKNTGVTILNIVDNKVSVELLNDVSHLN